MLYRRISCGHCKKTIPMSASYLDVIGIPFVSCPHCGVLCKHQQITEWDLHTFAQKFSFVFMAAVSAVVLGGLGGVCAAVLAAKVIGIAGKSVPPQVLFACSGGGILLAALLLIRHYGGKITASRLRLGDPAYRLKLVKLGVLATASSLKAPDAIKPRKKRGAAVTQSLGVFLAYFLLFVLLVMIPMQQVLKSYGVVAIGAIPSPSLRLMAFLVSLGVPTVFAVMLAHRHYQSFEII